MVSLYLLVPIALIFVGLAVWAFLWAVHRDQFDDLENEAHRILFDEDLKTGDRNKPLPGVDDEHD